MKINEVNITISSYYLKGQIDQTRLLLETYSQKGAVLKLFSEGLFLEGTHQWSWRVGHVVAPGGLASGVGELLSTWRVPPFVLAKCFFTEIFFITSNGYNF